MFKPGSIAVSVGALVALGLLNGCGRSGSGLEKVVVTGTVTLDTQPIANGEIRFHPIDGTQGPVSGAPIRDGKYIAQGKGGVPFGTHRVVITGFRPGRNAAANPEGGPVEQYVPAKFNDQSILTAEVTADTETANFDLKSN